MFHGANEKHINVIEFGIIPLLLLLLLLNKERVITWTGILFSHIYGIWYIYIYIYKRSQKDNKLYRLSSEIFLSFL